MVEPLEHMVELVDEPVLRLHDFLLVDAGEVLLREQLAVVGQRVQNDQVEHLLVVLLPESPALVVSDELPDLQRDADQNVLRVQLRQNVGLDDLQQVPRDQLLRWIG